MIAAKRYSKPAIIFAIICLFQWAFLFQDLNPTWDAAFYYSYARSLVFDGDLHIADDLALSYPTASADFVNKGMDQDRTDTGRVNAPFAIGSALLWIPWLASLRILSILIQPLNFSSGNLTGFEWFFTINLGLLSAALAWIAFWIGYRIARKEIDRFSSLASVITLLFATPLLYYQYREPLYSHATSAFATGLVVYIWWKSYRSSPRYNQAVLLGALIGLATLVRWQHLVYFILPVVSTIWWWIALSKENRRPDLFRGMAYLALTGLFTVAVFSSQLVHWKITFGSWITVPQGSTFINWQAPYILSVLFSSFRGLLPWMPGALLGALGLILLARKNLRLALPLILVLVLDLYVNSSVRDWFAGGGYGPRRFTSELVILIVGYSGLIKSIPNSFRKSVAVLMGGVLILHQLLLMRYGLADQIGGRVESMDPTFQWNEEPYATFFGRLLSHIPASIRDPVDFLVHLNSPLDHTLSGQFPSHQVIALIITVIFMITMWLSFRYARKRLGKYSLSFGIVTLTTLLAIVIFDVYILLLA